MESYLQEMLGLISKTYILGMIPLDTILHLFIGAALTIILLKMNLRFPLVMVLILLLTFLKEYYDSHVLNATMAEHVKDILASIAFPALLILIRYLKKRRHS